LPPLAVPACQFPHLGGQCVVNGLDLGRSQGLACCCRHCRDAIGVHLEDLPRYLKLAGLLVIFFGIVPLAGFLVSGSLKHAWEYSKIWLKCMAILAAVGGVLSIIALAG
jgi:hypothetical protein